MELENYDYEVQYIKGTKNDAADCLSRVKSGLDNVPEHDQAEESVYTNEELAYPDMDFIRDAQKKDKDIASAMQQLKRDQKVKEGRFKNFSGMCIENDLLMKGLRVVIPQTCSARIINEYHGQNHPGADNTTLMLKSRFYWRGMAQEVENFVANCRVCAKCKHTKLPRAEMNLREKDMKPRERLAIDFASMPKSKRGNNSFLLMVDSATKYHAVKVGKDQTGPTVEDGLITKWFTYFGYPKEILSDQAKNVDGKVVKGVCSKFGIKVWEAIHTCVPEADPTRRMGGIPQQCFQHINKAK